MPNEPRPRSETLRQELRDVLMREVANTRDLSGLLGVSEKDLLPHLEHLQRSLSKGKPRFRIEPASCHQCGFVFKKRSKLSKPSRCPGCKSERIEPARFTID